MRAGSLRYRVVIEAPAIGQDAYGEAVGGWAPFATRWAKREDLPGTEAYSTNGAQDIASGLTRFSMRYLDGVAANMRITCDGVAYDVASIADDGRRRETIILASRVS